MTELENVISILQTEFKNLRNGIHYSLKYHIDTDGSEIKVSTSGITHNLDKSYGWRYIYPELVYTPIVLKWLSNKNNLRRIKTDIEKLDIIDRCRKIYGELENLSQKDLNNLKWFGNLSQQDLLKKTVKQLYAYQRRLTKISGKFYEKALKKEKETCGLANKIIDNLSD